MNKSERRKSIDYKLLYILTIASGACSIFAQLPDIIAIPMLKNILTYVPWLVTAGYLLVMTSRVYYTDLKIFIFPAMILTIHVVGRIFGIYYYSTYLRAVLIASLILFLGILLGLNVYKEDFNKILYGYVICVIVFACYVYFVIFKGVALSGAESVKLEGGKNSSSIIILSGITLILYNDFILKRTKYLFIAFLAFLIILIKSRTAMLACLVLIVAKIFIGTKNVKKKIAYVTLLCVVYYLLIYQTNFYDIVVKRIFLKGKELNEENLDKITSGRTHRFQWVKDAFKKHWFIGTGSVGEVIENFYYLTIGCYGVFFGLVTFGYAFSPLYYIWKDRKEEKDGDLRLTLFVILLVMALGGVGEALCPYGPGVKCYILWLVFGYYIGHRNTKKGENDNKIINNNPRL